MLDGVHLETLGVEDVDGTNTLSLAVLATVAFTPAEPSETDTQQAKLVIVRSFQWWSCSTVGGKAASLHQRDC